MSLPIEHEAWSASDQCHCGVIIMQQQGVCLVLQDSWLTMDVSIF